MRLYVGTSGWQYRHWRGRFYSALHGPQAELRHYASKFQTVEVNNSFYRLPDAATFKQWAEATPDDFVFAIKASRYLTHILRLKEPDDPARRLLERARNLGAKLGPILLQLPPNMQCDVGRLDEALAAFPGCVRVAVEFRHASWFDDRVRATLAHHGASLCLVDRKSRLVTPAWRTADWGYMRLHEGTAAPCPCYGAKALAARLALLEATWPAEESVYVYFNNDPLACAVHDAAQFGAMARARGNDVSRTPPPREVAVG